jgi:hypothetical protein
MGNIIMATSSIFVPIVTKTITYPYIIHPYRWGGIPWEEPNFFFETAIIKVLNFGTIMSLAALSNMINSMRECRKADLWLSYRRAILPLIGYIIGHIFAYMFPMIKTPLLSFLSWLPYAGFICDGIIAFPFVLLFGSMGTAKTRADVC